MRADEQRRTAPGLHIEECLCCSELFVAEESTATNEHSFCSQSCQYKLLGPVCFSCGTAGVFFYPVYIRGLGVLPFCGECINSCGRGV